MFNKTLVLGVLVLSTTVLVWCSSSPEATPNPWTPTNEVAVPTPEPMPEPMAQEQTIVDIVVETEDVSTLRDIVVALDLVDTLASEWPFTVFAPTNDAFTALLMELGLTFDELAANEELLSTIVLYHVIEGAVPASAVLAMEDGTQAPTLNGESITISNENGVMVDQSTVIVTDIMASNGVIHLIDTVLLPQSVRDALSAEAQGTVVETAIESGQFPTLVAAIQAAWLVETLNSEWPFTVFAPTEEAFAALLVQLDVTAEELLANTELLTTVLTYHVLPGTYSAEDVVGLSETTSFTTVQWTDVAINPNNGQPTVNDSSIVDPDIFASNGVIHVIDAVLIPSS